jgi:NAD(P)-dependent dehydrogenase (short-subunit alcohol dehydrogenase family)
MDIASYRKLVPSPIALVTGANKGIGFEISRILAEAGIFVWMAGRDPVRINAAAASLKAKGLPVDHVPLDVTDPKSVAAAAKHVQDISGALDILVNNAGIVVNERRLNAEGKPEGIPPSEIELDTLRQTYETNVFGVFNVTKALLPLLRKSAAGRLVNMSSGLGSLTWRSDPNWTYSVVNALASCSSKTAVNGVTVAFAKELKDTAIKVNAADPGYCATDLNGHSGPRSAEQGAQVAVHLATLDADGPTSSYFNDDGVVPW